MINTLPTDNLYKFLALSGIILILSSGYSFATFIEQYETELVYLQTTSDKFKLKSNQTLEERTVHIKELKEATKKLSKYNKDLDEYVYSNLKDEKIIILYDYYKFSPLELGKYIQNLIQLETERLDKRELKVKELATEMKLLNIELTKRLNLIEIKEKYYQIFYYSTLFAFGAGCFLMIVGFSQWFHIQKIQDQQLKSSLNNHIIKLH